MVALIVGVILIAFCVFAVIPASLCGFGLDWSREVIDFLKGFAPVFAASLLIATSYLYISIIISFLSRMPG